MTEEGWFPNRNQKIRLKLQILKIYASFVDFTTVIKEKKDTSYSEYFD